VDSPEVRTAVRLALSLRVTPTDLIDVTGNPREMRTSEVRTLIARRRHAGFDVTAHRVELHNRFAFPLSSVWLVLAAVPWALDPDRRRSLAVTLGAGVVAVALELALSQIFRVLALAHKIAAPWGAWGAPAVCIAAIPVSYALYQRRRTRGAWF
jgi:lipopolysaccharide export LptBFGC system permease protein LptF